MSILSTRKSVKSLLSQNNKDNKLALILSSAGLLLLLLLTFTLPFNQGLFSKLFTKPSSHAASLPSVNIIGVYVNNSSAKIDFDPVPGAQDYRVYDVSDPMVVKYAGIRHVQLEPPLAWTCGTCHLAMQSDGVTPQVPLQMTSSGTGPTLYDFPSPEIEWNLLEDGKPHTLVVEALDSVGPVPQGNLYDELNSPILSPAPNMSSMGMNMGMQTLGIDEGPTADGKYSINGQRAYGNNPQVIAESQPFVVQANSDQVPVPSKPDATQSFLDTFDDSEAPTLQLEGAVDNQAGNKTYSLNAGTSKAWDIIYQSADSKDSFPFIDGGHFMDVLFDGATPGYGCPNVCHNNHTVMAMTPKQTADFSGGKILHVTMELDLHNSGRRWSAINLSPANDPLTNWYTANAPINNSDQALFLQFFPLSAALDIYNGPGSDGGPTGDYNADSTGSTLWGEAGGANPYAGSYTSYDLGGDGIAFDNRSRVDFFLTQDRVALFIDGQLVQQSDIPHGMPFTDAKVYFSHYIYHSAQEELTAEGDLTLYNCYAMNAFWYNDPQNGIVPGSGQTGGTTDACNLTFPPGFGFRFSDERHWDNMGFEVLPATDVPAGSDWSSLASLINMPVAQPPQYVATSSATPMTSISPMPSPSITPTLQPTSTPSSCPSKTGDFNGDGVVNLTDLSIFSANFGTSSPNILDPCTDLNGDGVVNLTDLSLFSAVFGT